jgi:hypothetical protein
MPAYIADARGGYFAGTVSLPGGKLAVCSMNIEKTRSVGAWHYFRAPRVNEISEPPGLSRWALESRKMVDFSPRPENCHSPWNCWLRLSRQIVFPLEQGVARQRNVDALRL